MSENFKESNSAKISFKMKAGYAVGQLTDSFAFNLFFVFFLYFLTDFAGIPPATAGTIMLISLIWDAITDPVIGQISDNLNSRWGRRRPLMLASLIPYGLCVYLLFTDIPMGISAKSLYFTLLTIVFWSIYKVFVIPFFALGAELTDDFDERTSLRVWASFLLYVAVLAASALPLKVVDFTVKLGGTQIKGWSNVGLLFGLMTIITGYICWLATRGGEKVLNIQDEEGEVKDKKPGGGLLFITELIFNIKEITKLSSTRWLAGSVFLWSFVSSMSSGALVYLMASNLKYSVNQQTLGFTIYSLCAIAWLPVISIAAAKFDKKVVYSVFLFASGLGISFFYLIGFPSMMFLGIYFVIIQLGNCTFWTLYYSMMYDISELDEFVTGKRREGAIAAFMSFTQKVGSAVSVWVLGFFLGMHGYDGLLEIQSGDAQEAILALNTYIPAVVGILAALCAFAYPLSKGRFGALMLALESKRSNKAYSTKGFERLL